MDFSDFLQWEQASRDTIDFKKIYVDMTGDLVAGLLLSQIIYWHLPDKTGERSKLRVIKNGKHYLVKSQKDWWDECRITEKQYRRAIKILKDLSIAKTEIHRFNNFPTTHIYLNKPRFVKLYEKALNANKNPVNADINNPVIDERSKTEIDQRSKPVIDERDQTLTETTEQRLSESTSVPVNQAAPDSYALTLFSKQNPVFKDITLKDWQDLIGVGERSVNDLMDVLIYVDKQIERGKNISNVGGYIREALEQNWEIDFENSDPWYTYFGEIDTSWRD